MLPDQHNDTLPVRSSISPKRNFSDSQAAIRARLEVMRDEQELLERNRARLAARRQPTVVVVRTKDTQSAEVRHMRHVGAILLVLTVLAVWGLCIVSLAAMGLSQ